MKFLGSLVVVADMSKSRALYEKILGQKVVADFGENISFAGGFSLHQRDHFAGLTGHAPVRGPTRNFELYFEDDEVDHIQTLVVTHGLELVHGVTEQPWRQRVLRFLDYDGTMIEVGERMEHVAYRLSQEGLSVEEIAAITYLTEESVIASRNEYSKLKKV